MKRGSSLRFMRHADRVQRLRLNAHRRSLVRRYLAGAGRLAERPGRLLHGFHDVVVAGAPAQVAGEPLANVGLARIRLVLQQRVRREQHAGRAVAALQAVLIPEALLQRVQLAALPRAPRR